MLDKTDLIEKLAERGYTKKGSKIILDDIFSVMKESLAEGEGIYIHGFGKFEIKMSKERETIDIKSRKRITIEPRKQVFFTPGDSLRSVVKDGFLRKK